MGGGGGVGELERLITVGGGDWARVDGKKPMVAKGEGKRIVNVVPEGRSWKKKRGG